MQWSWLQAFHLFADTFERWPLASTTDEIEVVECWWHGQFGGKRGPGKFPLFLCDLNKNSPHCVPYISYELGSQNLALSHAISPR